MMPNVVSFAQENTLLVVLVGVATFVLAPVAYQLMGFHVWYVLTLLLAAVVSVAAGYPLYFWPFLLGMTTAFAEIISKFNDDPLKALKTPHALFYHVLNGLIAVFALYFLALVSSSGLDFAGVGRMDQLKYAMTAGLGAMLVMRSKLFNIKVDGDDISFGPEQIIKILFRFMEAGIDRTRARARYEFVKGKLNNINFEAVRDYCLTQLLAAQALEEEKRKRCLDSIADTQAKQVESQLKSHELGYVLLNTMGEDFVSEIFAPPIPSEWYIRAPTHGESNGSVLPTLIPVKSVNPLLNALPFVGQKEETVLFMAYGPNMSSNHMRERLNWIDAEGQERLSKTSPTKCVLKDFRLAFNKEPEGGSPGEALVNITSEKGDRVEGVLYQLPSAALDFLKQREEGYHDMNVTVQVKDEEKPAKVLVADSSRIVPARMPKSEELNAMIEGAAEHDLSAEYIERLKALVPEPVA